MAKTLLLAGHGKLPQGTAATGLYDTLAVITEIDAKYGVILKASCTLVTDTSRDYVENILVGYSLQDGVEDIIQEIKNCYHGAAQNAIIAALKDLYRSYQSKLMR